MDLPPFFVGQFPLGPRDLDRLNVRDRPVRSPQTSGLGTLHFQSAGLDTDGIAISHPVLPDILGWQHAKKPDWFYLLPDVGSKLYSPGIHLSFSNSRWQEKHAGGHHADGDRFQLR